MRPSSRVSGKTSKMRIARGCPARSCPKYASRSQPSMRGLAFKHRVASTLEELPRRWARNTWPKPPSPSRRSITNRSRLSGLATTSPRARYACAGCRRSRVAMVRVVAVETCFTGRPPLTPLSCTNGCAGVGAAARSLDLPVQSLPVELLDLAPGRLLRRHRARQVLDVVPRRVHAVRLADDLHEHLDVAARVPGVESAPLAVRRVLGRV